MDDMAREFAETYEILGEIGKGGGGVVYKAYHKRLQKEVVLKRIHSNLKNINTRAETDILKNIRHACLPTVLDFLEIGGNTYTVMDYICGRSLKECLDERQQFPQAEIIDWFRQLCEALTLLHSQNPPIIHGDIKPANIMLTPSGKICLIDFNIAGVFEGDHATVSGYTPGYAPPEQIRCCRGCGRKSGEAVPAGWQQEFPEEETLSAGMEVPFVAGAGDTGVQEETVLLQPGECYGELRRNIQGNLLPEAGGNIQAEMQRAGPREEKRETVDVRTDIYSLGATVYHLLTGEKPGPAPVPEIRERIADVNEPLAGIVMKCLKEDPAERYQKAEELSQALGNIYTSTSAYQSLLKKQKFARALLCAGIVGFLGLAYAGSLKMRQEQDYAYQELVSRESGAADRKDWEEMEAYCSQASGLFPERAEAYQIKGEALYQRGEYEEAVRFLTGAALPYTEEGDGRANLFVLVANCYFELEDYAQAKTALEEALGSGGAEKSGTGNSAVYRDYAVTLARLGDIAKATEILRTAIRQGLGDDGLHYTSGEIACASGKYQDALKEFAAAAADSDDGYLKMRAYVMQAEIMAKQEQTPERCAERIALLERAQEELPVQYLNAVLRQLVQAYLDFADSGGGKQACRSAIGVLREMESYQWDTYVTHQNVVILCQRHQLFEEAEQELGNMLKLYGEDYRTYKHLAFLEVSRENQKEMGERDYTSFRSRYERALELYEGQNAHNQTDADMETLRRLYLEAEQGGWF